MSLSRLNLAAFLISNAFSAIFYEMAYFLTAVTMKLILVRSCTSYSGMSVIRAGMKSPSATIVEFCLIFPVALISIKMIIIGISGGFQDGLWLRGLVCCGETLGL